MKQKINPILVQEKLREKHIKIFTPEEFSRIFSVSLTQTKYFLETYARKGFLTRLKKGLYVLKNQFPSEEEIANVLYRPSYISFEYVLARHGIIPEMVYAVTSATAKSTRHFSVNEKEFPYYTIKKSAFAGFYLVKEGDKSFLVAEPEKALADYLYFVSLGKRSLNERINIRNLKKEKIIRYAKMFKKPKILDLLEKL